MIGKQRVVIALGFFADSHDVIDLRGLRGARDSDRPAL
jgi:hypothetical protein